MVRVIRGQTLFARNHGGFEVPVKRFYGVVVTTCVPRYVKALVGREQRAGWQGGVLEIGSVCGVGVLVDASNVYKLGVF